MLVGRSVNPTGFVSDMLVVDDDVIICDRFKFNLDVQLSLTQ